MCPLRGFNQTKASKFLLRSGMYNNKLFEVNKYEYTKRIKSQKQRRDWMKTTDNIKIYLHTRRIFCLLVGVAKREKKLGAHSERKTIITKLEMPIRRLFFVGVGSLNKLIIVKWSFSTIPSKDFSKLFRLTSLKFKPPRGNKKSFSLVCVHAQNFRINRRKKTCISRSRN